jgi:hypothetical protein
MCHAVAIDIASITKEAGYFLNYDRCLLWRALRVAAVSDRNKAKAGAVQPRRLDALTLTVGRGLEPALVRELGDEPADVRMHSPRPSEEQAVPLVDGRAIAEQMLENR